MAWNAVANHEKGGMGLMSGEDIQDARRDGWVGTIIDGQGDQQLLGLNEKHDGGIEGRHPLQDKAWLPPNEED